MTNPIAKRAVLSACVLAFSWSYTASACNQDQAIEKYVAINLYASNLKLDAEQNPSNIPLRSGKNDPRLKKSIKITKQTKQIKKENIDTAEYGTACSKMDKIASKYKIDVDQSDDFTAEKGMKVATQANAMKKSLDKAKRERKAKRAEKRKDKLKLPVRGF